VDRYIRVGAASAAKIRLIPNGVDLSRFRPDLAARARLRRELGVDDRSVLLSVARFEPQKDHANLLAAMRLIVDLRPDVMLFLVGQGSLEQEIRLKAEALGLSNHVQFLGTRSDIPAVMNASDVYVMSSLWEGLPLVLIEAASVGLPIVATDVGGNSEVVLPSASGILVRPADPGAIAEAALSVLGVPRAEREQWSATGRAVVEDEYSLEGVLDRWETLYRELWGRKAVGAHPQRDDKEPPKKDLLFSEWDIPI
jgi:glycosyltransferase involved in cell wall biosynthesis